MYTEIAMFVVKVAAALAFLVLVEFVAGCMVALINMCVFFPPTVLTILKACIMCVCVSAVYKLFY